MMRVRRHITLITLLLVGHLAGCATTDRQARGPSERQKTAMSIFAERCKKTGTFIRRQVDDVEGVLLIRIRPSAVNFDDQYALDDPYGSDLGGEAYVASFLRGSWEYWTGQKSSPIPTTAGYLYVEAVDETTKTRYRYTGSVKDVMRVQSVMNGGDGKTKFTTKDFVVARIPSSGSAPRFGVTYEDISTREDRDYWIAGSSLKVIDLHKSEVIAERVGYMVDAFQGSQAGGRSPWLLATNYSCPAFRGRPPSLDQIGQTVRFVEEVLKPVGIQGR